MKRTLVIFAMLIFPWVNSYAQETGLEVLRSCGAAVKQADGLPVSDQERIEAIWCLGYLGGFADSLKLSASLFKPQNQKVCLPDKGTSNEQLVRIVTKWLKDNPQDLHQSGRMSVLIALGNAFPCK